MTKTREDAMADRREGAMAEEKMGKAEAKVRDSIWSVPFVILMDRVPNVGVTTVSQAD